MREGDIEALHRRMKDEGRPIKSNIIRGRGENVFFTRKNGRVKVDEVVKTER